MRMSWVRRKVSVLLTRFPASLDPGDSQTQWRVRNLFIFAQLTSFKAKNCRAMVVVEEKEPANHFKGLPIMCSDSLHLL